MKKLLVAAVSASALFAAGCAHHRASSQNESSSRTAGTVVDDAGITAKVKTAIFEQPSLKSAEINVETFKGVVQLSGFVSSASNESTAVKVASAVEGVKSVKNDMRVK